MRSVASLITALLRTVAAWWRTLLEQARQYR